MSREISRKSENRAEEAFELLVNIYRGVQKLLYKTPSFTEIDRVIRETLSSQRMRGEDRGLEERLGRIERSLAFMARRVREDEEEGVSIGHMEKSESLLDRLESLLDRLESFVDALESMEIEITEETPEEEEGIPEEEEPSYTPEELPPAPDELESKEEKEESPSEEIGEAWDKAFKAVKHAF